MQKAYITIKCERGHQAKYFCAFKTCQHSSAICNDESCECFQVHKECQFPVNAQSLYERLEEKAYSKTKEQDELILSTIEKLLKSLEVFKNEYLDRSKDISTKLTENEYKLFQILKKGYAYKLKPQFVHICLQNNLKDKPVEKNNQIQKLKNILDFALHTHFNRLNQIRTFWKQSQEPKSIEQFLFHESHCNSQYLTVQNQGTKIRMIEEDHDRRRRFGNSYFSLVSPSLKELDQKITFKILKMRGWMSFGMAEKRTIIQNNWLWPQDCCGLYSIKSNGWANNTLDQKQNQKYLQFQFKQGDEIELRHNKQLKQLVFKNITNNMSVSLNNILNKYENLHYCVSTLMIGDEIEIIENK